MKEAIIKALVQFREPIIFITGAAVGCGITYLAVRSHFDKIAKKEIEEAKAFYSQVVVSGYVSTPDKDSHVKKEKEEKIERKPASYESDRETKYIDYGSFYPKKKVTVELAEMESPPEGDELDGRRMAKEADSEVGIRFISPESFSNDFPQFGKDTLYYYALDETLVNENEEIIDNPEEVIGNAVEVYGLNYDDSVGSVWVRNFDLACDYEINKVAGSFR